MNPQSICITVFALISLAGASGCDFLTESSSVTLKFPKNANCDGRNGVGPHIKLNEAVTDGQFVVLAYSAILQRPPEPEGLNGYCLLLKNGTANRKQLVDRFVGSPEFAGIK